MSYVEIGAKDLARMLSIMSDYFGKKEMSEDDVKRVCKVIKVGW